MMRFIRWASFAFGTLLLLMIGIWGFGHLQQKDGKEKTYQFRLAEIHEASYPTSLADVRFAELVKERTNGRIQIEVYSGGVLGDEVDVMEQLQLGTVEFARISMAPVAEFVNKLYVLMLPYLYEDSAHMWRVLESDLGKEMLDSVKEAGLIGLAWYDSGARSFYLTEEVREAKDMHGKRIRVQMNSMMLAMGEALGAKPKMIPESEISNAIVSNSIDGAENNIPTYESFKQYEVCPYYIMDEHIRIPDLLVGSQIALLDLSEEDRKIIKECAKEAQEYEKALWHEREQQSIQNLKEKGVVFVELTKEEKESFVLACESVYKEFGAEYLELVKGIKSK